jgi:hypothetical protein
VVSRCVIVVPPVLVGSTAAHPSGQRTTITPVDVRIAPELKHCERRWVCSYAGTPAPPGSSRAGSARFESRRLRPVRVAPAPPGSSRAGSARFESRRLRPVRVPPAPHWWTFVNRSLGRPREHGRATPHGRAGAVRDSRGAQGSVRRGAAGAGGCRRAWAVVADIHLDVVVADRRSPASRHGNRPGTSMRSARGWLWRRCTAF